jgi:hypothetical protein
MTLEESKGAASKWAPKFSSYYQFLVGHYHLLKPASDIFFHEDYVNRTSGVLLLQKLTTVNNLNITTLAEVCSSGRILITTFQVLTAMRMKTIVSWAVTQCGSVGSAETQIFYQTEWRRELEDGDFHRT